MSILWDEQKRLFCIHTKNSTYQMKVDEQLHLLHTYYGKKIDNTDMGEQLFFCDRGFSGNPYEVGKEDRTYSLDTLPQEYSCFGTGDYRITGLHVREASGNQSVTLQYVEHKIEPGFHGITGLPALHKNQEDAEGESLCVCLQDPCNGLEVELWYTVIPELDIIGRNVTLRNGGNQRLMLEKAASLSLDFPFGDLEWVRFQGRHAMENNLIRTEISHGISEIGSVRGTSSHHYNPFSILCKKETTETTGTCIGFSFLYSGEHQTQVEKDQADSIRILVGIHPDDFRWVLEKQQELELPQVVLSFSGEGFGALSRKYHETIRKHINRGKWNQVRRPVLINNWEATYFDFTGDQLVHIAKEAQKLGIELFVMDDGWFGKRDDDNSGLGDWFPNEEKLGCTLKELGNRITETGMQFGIWFEPEMVSEDSQLFKEHPDWVVRTPQRKPVLGRNQLVLDYANAEVCDYMIARISAILEDAPISYVKWDMNRSICDKYSGTLPEERQGEFAHRYVLGLYRILETLTQRYPDVLFEGCSGGGGRYDAGMMYYTPQIWLSDNTDAINRLTIQYGASFGYPISTMGAHVSAVPNHQTGRTTPLQTRGVVAMAGTFGYELDITKMEEQEKEQVKRQIQRFHQFYAMIQQGDYYRLSTPQEDCTAWCMVAKDRKEALVTLVYHGVEANQKPHHFSIPGLLPEACYEIQYLDEEQPVKQMSGLALLHGGLTVMPSKVDFEGMQIVIRLPS